MAGKSATMGRPVRSFWDVERLIGKVSRNDRGEVIQVRYTEKDTRTYVDVRVFWPDSGNEMRPGKGIALPIHLADEIAGFILQATETGEVAGS